MSEETTSSPPRSTHPSGEQGKTPWLPLGIAVGAAVGLSTGAVAVGIGVGIAIAAALQVAQHHRRQGEA